MLTAKRVVSANGKSLVDDTAWFAAVAAQPKLFRIGPGTTGAIELRPGDPIAVGDTLSLNVLVEPISCLSRLNFQWHLSGVGSVARRAWLVGPMRVPGRFIARSVVMVMPTAATPGAVQDKARDLDVVKVEIRRADGDPLDDVMPACMDELVQLEAVVTPPHVPGSGNKFFWSWTPGALFQKLQFGFPFLRDLKPEDLEGIAKPTARIVGCPTISLSYGKDRASAIPARRPNGDVDVAQFVAVDARIIGPDSICMGFMESLAAIFDPGRIANRYSVEIRPACDQPGFEVLSPARRDGSVLQVQILKNATDVFLSLRYEVRIGSRRHACVVSRVIKRYFLSVVSFPPGAPAAPLSDEQINSTGIILPLSTPDVPVFGKILIGAGPTPSELSLKFGIRVEKPTEVALWREAER